MKRLLLSLVLLPLLAINLVAQTPATEKPQSGSQGENAPAEREVIGWLKQNAIPLKSVEAGNGFADLQSLKQTLADVRVIGLGEATHGTREFFQFKHRMVEFMVREMGVTVFAFEDNYRAGLRVNDYVMNGKGNRAEAIQGLYPVWRTEEVAALVDWLKAYNETVAPERKVKFCAIDVQDPLVAWNVPNYLKQVAPEKAEEVNGQLFTPLPKAVNESFGGKKESLKALQPKVESLISYFVLQEAKFIYKTSRAQYEDKLHRLRLLAQCVDVYSQEWNDTRDRYMAENIVYLFSREPANARIALWAHNQHISAGELVYGGGMKAMGAFLQQVMGSAYYAFGFTFNEGSFQGISNPSLGNIQHFEYTVGPAGKNLSNWYFAQPGIGNYLIDFRQTTKSEVVTQWLQTVRPFGMFGGFNVAPEYKEAWVTGNFLKAVLGKEFDGMIHIERTTRARPLKQEPIKRN